MDGQRVLVKTSSAPFHQEPCNEVIASLISERLGLNHVTYHLLEENGEQCCYCEDFVSRDLDLVSAAQIIKSGKRPNDQSEYEFFISVCEQFGMTDIRTEMEKMLVLDYLIVNSDRHLNNFGLLRDARTLAWLGMAPIFDCGNSLWFDKTLSGIQGDNDENIRTPLWKKNPTANLELITDYSWLDLSVLDGLEEEAKAILSASKYNEPDRIQAICEAIHQRVEQLQEIAESQKESLTLGEL